MNQDAERVKQRLRLRLATKIQAAAERLVALHRRNLGTDYPPASQPGEFPRRRTGNLQAAVEYQPITVSEIADTLTCRVMYGPSAPYYRNLSRAGRLSIPETMDENRDELRSVFRSAGNNL